MKSLFILYSVFLSLSFSLDCETTDPCLGKRTYSSVEKEEIGEFDFFSAAQPEDFDKDSKHQQKRKKSGAVTKRARGQRAFKHSKKSASPIAAASKQARTLKRKLCEEGGTDASLTQSVDLEPAAGAEGPVPKRVRFSIPESCEEKTAELSISAETSSQDAEEGVHIFMSFLQKVAAADIFQKALTARDSLESARYYKLAADQGLMDAQCNYAVHLYKGEGVARNLAEAARYYKLAADQGLMDAQYLYAERLYKGEGVAKDLTEAARYSKLAADQGLMDAQYNYATLLYKGEGVAKDLTEAARYFKLAADQGHEAAQYNYARTLYRNKNVAEATKIFWKLLAAPQAPSQAIREEIVEMLKEQQK